MADSRQGKTPDDFWNGSSQSRVVLAKPRLECFGTSTFASSSSKSCNPFGSVLHLTQLPSWDTPFLKVSETDKSNKNKEAEGSQESTQEAEAPKFVPLGSASFASSSSKSCNPFGSVLHPAQLLSWNTSFLKVSETDKSNKNKEAEGSQESTQEAEVPKFVPLGTANATPRTNTTVPAPAQPPSTSSSGFIFGQNLSERVVIKEAVNNGDASVDHSSSNGTSELLFSSAAASVKENNQPQEDSTGGSAEGEGLAAAAAEYERSHARPPPPAAYCAMTGEEDETNVLQISCRLFAWESGSWRERGRGVLRLNDGAAGGGGARLVARVAGSLRVVLNTKLWPDMVVERAGNKSLRITAADAQQQVKLFLIMGAPVDITQLHRALMSRISLSKRSSISSKEDEKSQRSAERLEAAADDNDYLEKSVDDSNQEDDSNFDEEQSVDNAPDSRHDRLECSDVKPEDDIDQKKQEVPEDKETNALKRKEPVTNETSPKRHCQDNQ